MGQTDKECIRQCLNGNPDDYVGLVRRYQAPLVAYLAGRLRDAERAEETAQETFVRGYFALNKLDQTSSFFSWLMGIANRVVMEQNRLEKRRAEALSSVTPKTVSAHDADDGDLRQAVAALPQPYAEVVSLRYYGGLSCSELSERLNVPVGTVTKRLSRAYAMLRESIGQRAVQQKQNEVNS